MESEVYGLDYEEVSSLDYEETMLKLGLPGGSSQSLPSPEKKKMNYRQFITEDNEDNITYDFVVKSILCVMEQ